MRSVGTSPIAARTEFWWNPKRPDESTLWDSKIELSEKFLNEIIRHPVPIDMILDAGAGHLASVV